MKCQNGRFARVESPWTRNRPTQCDREATHQADGFCAQRVLVCPRHVTGPRRYKWDLKRLAADGSE